MEYLGQAMFNLEGFVGFSELLFGDAGALFYVYACSKCLTVELLSYKMSFFIANL
jgi:hypothetical protein